MERVVRMLLVETNVLVVMVVRVIAELIVILSVVPVVKEIVVLNVSEEDVLTAVFVSLMQEAFILFFKSLIKRIKIDINMTKLQVLGEYYEYIEVRYSEFV